MKKGIITIIMIFLVGVILTTIGCRKSSDDRFGYFFDKIANKLDLNEEQSEWLAGFKADLRVEIESIKKDKEEIHKELKKSFIEGDINETLLNDLIENKCISLQEKTPYIIGKVSEIHDNLTTEQRNKLVQIIKEFHDKKEKWNKGCKFFKSDGWSTEKISSHITEKIQDKLDLDDEQNVWLKTFVSDIVGDPALKSAKEELHAAKKEICETVLSEFVNDRFDTEKVGELIKNILPVELIKELPIASKVVEIQNNLTTEQRVDVVALIEKHKEKSRSCWSKKRCIF